MRIREWITSWIPSRWRPRPVEQTPQPYAVNVVHAQFWDVDGGIFAEAKMQGLLPAECTFTLQLEDGSTVVRVFNFMSMDLSSVVYAEKSKIQIEGTE